MLDCERYAIYYLPPPGPFADFGAAWLGWDVQAGRAVPHPPVAGLPRPVAEITAPARRYGFHATLKPPFRLARGQGAEGLDRALSDLAGTLAPVHVEGLRLTRMRSFLALTPEDGNAALSALAAVLVRELDPFRAAPDAEERSRRSDPGMTAAQAENLRRWGYPYVMDDFRFHMTLTGRLPEGEIDPVAGRLATLLAPVLPGAFEIDEIALVGEGRDGTFRELSRHALRARPGLRSRGSPR